MSCTAITRVELDTDSLFVPLAAGPSTNVFVAAMTSWGRIYMFLLTGEKTSTSDPQTGVINVNRYTITITSGSFSLQSSVMSDLERALSCLQLLER